MFDLKFIGDIKYILKQADKETTPPIKYIIVYSNKDEKKALEECEELEREINNDFRIWIYDRYLNRKPPVNIIRYNSLV